MFPTKSIYYRIFENQASHPNDLDPSLSPHGPDSSPALSAGTHGEHAPCQDFSPASTPLATVVIDDDTLFDDGADPEAPLLSFSDEDWAAEVERALLDAEPARKAA